MSDKICCYLLILLLILFTILLAEYINVKHQLKEKILPISEKKEEIAERIREKDKSDNEYRGILKHYLRNKSDDRANKSDSSATNRFIPDALPISEPIVISQTFSSEHPGIDFAAGKGSKVWSSAAGKIEVARYDEYLGNMVIIEHFNGYYTYYAHLEELYVKPGDFVEKLELIGIVGSTGFSTGPHLHYSIQKNKKYIDPEILIGQRNR